MSDVLNDDDMHALAAEYVLGTLEPDERVRAHAMLDVDHGFRAMVRIWERRFSELHLMVEPVDPPPQIWDRIKGQLGVTAPNATEPAPASTATPTAAAAPAAAPASPAPPKEKTPETAAPAAEVATSEAVAERAPTEGGAAVPAAEAAIPATDAEDQPGSATPAASADVEATTWVPLPEESDTGRGLRAWRALALVMMVFVVGLLGLGAALKFFPHRVPAAVQTLFQPSGEGPWPGPRRPAPSAQFEE